MHNSNKLTTQDVVLAINNWVRRDGYSQVFKESMQTILQEIVGRRANQTSSATALYHSGKMRPVMPFTD